MVDMVDALELRIRTEAHVVEGLPETAVRFAAHRFEARRQLGQPLDCRSRPRMFVVVEGDRPVVVVNRYDRTVEPTFGHCNGSPFLALNGERIAVGARESFE